MIICWVFKSEYGKSENIHFTGSFTFDFQLMLAIIPLFTERH